MTSIPNIKAVTHVLTVWVICKFEKVSQALFVFCFQLKSGCFFVPEPQKCKINNSIVFTKRNKAVHHNIPVKKYKMTGK